MGLPLKPLFVTGMYGMGDCIHQRAVVRELMTRHAVTLETYYPPIYHDLEASGLKVRILGTPKPRIRCRTQVKRQAAALAAGSAPHLRMTYGPAQIARHGSILGAMYDGAGLRMGPRPDFSLPAPAIWREWLRREHLDRWQAGAKMPIMLYRPIVQNNVWHCAARSPDPAIYGALFQTIREKFFVVSVANLAPGKEWIVGDEQDADVKLHADELDFETLAALAARADLIFGNAGFMPVLAQAVGTPNVVVYGGKESSRTTQAVSAHLAPTLMIDPDHACDCHDCGHACDKRIAFEPARERLLQFVDDVLAGKIVRCAA
jgi:hypothetical protein